MVFATADAVLEENGTVVQSHSRQRDARWNARSSSVIERIGGWSARSRVKLVPMLVAPFLSRLSGIMQSRCVERRKSRLFFPISSSTAWRPRVSPCGLHGDLHVDSTRNGKFDAHTHNLVESPGSVLGMVSSLLITRTQLPTTQPCAKPSNCHSQGGDPVNSPRLTRGPK